MTEYAMNIKTVQTTPFRILIEALKEILTDANFIFDSTGIKLVATDTTQVILVHLKLKAEKFDYYYCPEKLVVGVSLINFFKLVKAMGNHDTLTLFVEKNDLNKLGICIENVDKNSVTKFKLNMLDLPEKETHIPPETFESVITMPTGDFQKICRDMYNISEVVDIKSIGSQLVLSCDGDFASRETKIGETEYGLAFVKSNNPSEIVQGCFNLKYLVLFTKCTNLCNSIEMYLKNNFPLIIVYSVASLGAIKLCLAPRA